MSDRTIPDNGRTQADYIREALTIYEDILALSDRARAALANAEVTPGLGLDVWSHNVQHYAGSVKAQLRTWLEERGAKPCER